MAFIVGAAPTWSGYPGRQHCGARRGVRMGTPLPGGSTQSGGGGGGSGDAGDAPAAKPAKPARLPVTDSVAEASRRLAGESQSSAGGDDSAKDANGEAIFAEPSAGEAGAAPVGTGLGPRRGQREKRVTKAAAAQGSMGFADAWASQNRDRGGSRIDVWAIIGLLFILTPFVIIGIAVYTGAIPTGGLFD
jgi:hypothetical protein